MHYLIKDKQKKELILQTILNKYLPELFNKHKDFSYVLVGTTFNVYLAQQTQTTFNRSKEEFKELICHCYLIKNKFHLKYLDNDGVIQVFDTPLLHLSKYLFPGFSLYSGKDLYEIFNLVKIAYCCLVTKHTWIYDYIEYLNELRPSMKGLQSVLQKKLLTSVSIMVCERNQEITVEGYVIGDQYFATVEDYAYLRPRRETIQLKELKHPFNDNFTLFRYKSIKEYLIDCLWWDSKVVNLPGLKLKGVLEHRENAKKVIAYFNYENWKVQDLNYAFASNDVQNCQRDLADIQKMLKDLQSKSNILPVRINQWRKYLDYTSFDLSFNEIKSLKKTHDAIVKYYNNYLQDYSKYKSYLENKETNDILAKIYNEDHIITQLVSKLKDSYILNSVELFIEEGRKQSNCVASYVKYALSKLNYVIIHYKGCTIEIEDTCVKQCKLAHNKDDKEVQTEVKQVLSALYSYRLQKQLNLAC